MNGDIVFCLGLFLNLIVLGYCCKRWKTLNNAKYLVTTQAVFSSLTIIINLAFLLENLESFRGSKFLCYYLPVMVVFLLSLALFNLTALVFVIHAQLAGNWQLRRASAILICVFLLSITAALASPIFYSIDTGWSIIQFDGCLKNASVAVHGKEDEKPVNINVVCYVFWFLVLQFLIPAVIITNRIALILVHLWFEEKPESEPAKPTNEYPIRIAINAFSFFAFAILLFLLHNDEDDPRKALEYLNSIFHNCVLLSVVLLCWPWYLIEMLEKEEEEEEEEVSPLKNKDQIEYGIL